MEGRNNNKNFRDYTDTELTIEIQKGNQTAFEEMVSRYKGLIGYFASQYSAAGYDHADFMQEGLLALHSACKTYNENKKASFRNYAGVCINNRFMSLIRKANAKSVIPGNSIISFDDIDPSDYNRNNPETMILEQESSNELVTLIRETLSPFELSVLKAYLKGLSYAQIGQMLSVSAKAVDNAMQRIRRKTLIIIDNI